MDDERYLRSVQVYFITDFVYEYIHNKDTLAMQVAGAVRLRVSMLADGHSKLQSACVRRPAPYTQEPVVLCQHFHASRHT